MVAVDDLDGEDTDAALEVIRRYLGDDQEDDSEEDADQEEFRSPGHGDDEVDEENEEEDADAGDAGARADDTDDDDAAAPQVTPAGRKSLFERIMSFTGKRAPATPLSN